MTPPRMRPWGLAVLLLMGCGAASGPSDAQDAPLVRGPIESITHHATATGMVVRAAPGSREMCGISATVDHATRIQRRTAAGALAPAALAELEVGDTVEVYVSGPVAESCPVQGRADAVVASPR